MRVLYSCLFYLLIPAILLRLFWRGFKAPDYRQRWHERFACYNKAAYNNKLPTGVIWFHAVSVGEAEALFPLIKQIQQRHPAIPLLITTTTPTGSARVKAVLKDSVAHVYLPYDLPDAVRRFMQCFKPRLAVIVETEIWPNLFSYCGKHNIPLCIINARLSEKSSRRYQKIPSLIAHVLAGVNLVAAQSRDDAGRFIAIGAKTEAVKTFGNIKFDVDIPQAIIEQGLQLKAQYFAGRFVWLVASTHKHEEPIFLSLYQEIKQRIPELLLIIAPRHPERFNEVRTLTEQQGLTVTTRTSGASCPQASDVYLLDTMGELKMFYAASDAAFVGGSMVNTGGHNILEPVAIGVPTLFGPYMSNFKQIAEGILKQDAALQCQDREAIAAAIYLLHQDPVYKENLAEKGRQFILQNRGVITKICAALDDFI